MASKLDNLEELEILPSAFPYIDRGEDLRLRRAETIYSSGDGFRTRSKSGYVGMFRHIYLSLKPPILTKGYPYA